MPFEHFDRLFVFVAIGMSLFLIGGANLLLRRRAGKVVAALVVGGLVLAVTVSLSRAELAVRAATVLGGVLLVAGLLGSSWACRQLTNLVALVRRPSVRWGLV